MNPLLSLSFLSSGPAAGSEPVSHQVGSAMDETGATDNFGRLLNQSGEQQQLSDRQNFAALQITGKSKRAASMEGKATGKPEQTLPPVIPPEAELSLVDDGQAGTLLGLLDLASQTRLQLKLHANEKAHSAGHTFGTVVTGAENAEEVAVEGTGDKAIIMAELAGITGNKAAKGEWFILPVDPQRAATDAAKSDKAEHDASNKASASNTESADSSNSSDSSDKAEELAVVTKGRDGTTAQNLILSENAAQPELKAGLSGDNSAAMTAGKGLTKQGEETTLSQAALNADDQPDSTAGSRGDATTAASIKSDAEGAVAAKNDNMINLARAADTNAAHTEADDTVSETVAALERSTAAEAAQTSDAQSAKQQPITADMAIKADARTSGEDTAAAAMTASKTAAQGISPATSATIFENAEKSILLEDGQPASTLASAATVADSSQARAQQRAGLAENNLSLKQALTEDPDLVGQHAKTDPGLMAGGARAETAISGFAGSVGPAATSQNDAAIARLDAATVAIAGAQQSAERAKAQSVNKSVTEQLKQVNLLTQDAAGQLKERINLMVRQNIQVAEIRLDPADLGQMQIRVNLQQEQASVQFIVQQQHAKELLEQQMPRLREMLQQQGIQLGEGQVQQQRQGDSQAGSQRNGSAGPGQHGSEQHMDEQATAVQLDVKLSDRIVDYYA